MNLNKTIIRALAAVFLMGWQVTSAYAADMTSDISFKGSGTEDSPFIISTLEEFRLFRDKVNNGESFDNQFVRLTDNINLASEVWQPIGSASAKFLGTFDGNENTISNLVVDVDANNAGLFGFASVVRNLKIANAKVRGLISVGAVAGELESSVGTIDNCHVLGRIEITGENSVGGLAGKGYANIGNCSVVGDGSATSFVVGVYGSTEEGDNVGGLIGHLGEGNTLGVTNSIVKAIRVAGTRKVGGLVGTTARANDYIGNAVLNITVESTATAEYANANGPTCTIGGIIGNYFGSASSGGILKDSIVKGVNFILGNAKSAGALVGGDRVNNGGAPVGVEASGNMVYMSTVSGATNVHLMSPVAKVGSVDYYVFEEAVAAAQSGDTVTLLADVTPVEKLTLPAGIRLNGCGKQINGYITAGGDLEFVGHTKVTGFEAGYTSPIITIGAGACLEINGSGRMVIGHGATFNITGTITNAKTANPADVMPSLIMPGASFTGNGVAFNVSNAYIKTTAQYCSSSKSASGTFDFKVENSIWEQFGKLAFEAQSTAAKVNFNLKDSVLTTTSHLVFGVADGEVVIDNSNVNVAASRQIENRSVMIIKNNAVVNGAVATSSNAKNPGTIIVENATYSVTGEFSGSDLGMGTVVLKRGANFTAGSITKANIQIDATDMTTGVFNSLTADLSKFEGAISVVNNDDLEAKIVDGKIVLVEKPIARIGTENYFSIADAIAAAQPGETVLLLRDVKLTGKLVINKAITIDGNGCSIVADETAIWYTVSGKLNIKNYKTHLIGVNASGITLKNVVLDCNNNAAGINVYCAQNTVFEDVSIINATRGVAALTVNGSTLTVSGEFKALGNSIAVDLANGTGVTSALGITFAQNTRVDLGGKVFKFAQNAVLDLDGAVTENGSAYFVAMDNAYCYSKEQMDARTNGYSNGLKILADISLNNDLIVKGTLDLNGRNLHFSDGKTLKTSGNLEIVGGSSVNSILITSISHSLKAPMGLNVATSVDSAKVVYGDGKYIVVEITFVARIGSDRYFETLSDALASALDGDAVELIWKEGDAPIAMNGSVFGKSVIISGSATVDWSKNFLYVGRGGEGDGTVIFDGAELKSASDSSSYGIHISGREKGAKEKYDGTVVINNSVIELDYLINKGAMVMTNSALTVKNGFAVGGRPASETESGMDATATIKLLEGSKLVVNNYNGMGLGYEAIGIMDIDSTSTFECTQYFLITEKGKLIVAPGGKVEFSGNVKTFAVNGTLLSGGDIFANITAGNTADIEITGGVYIQDVNQWCAEGCAALPTLDSKYVVGVQPTATVNNLGSMTIPAEDYYIYNGNLTQGTEAMPLNFVMQFVANQNSSDMLTSPFAEWYADFVITFEGIEGDSFDAKGCYLAGYYGSTDSWDGLWVKIPVDGILSQIDEGVRYPVMLGVGMAQTYDYICSGVQAFSCAMFIPDDILKANPNLKVKLELNLVDSGNGDDAAKQALEKGVNIFKVSETEYTAEDFAPKVELPEVQVIDIKKNLNDSDPDLTFALNFAIKDADKLTEDYLEKLFAKYGKYYTDYVLTINGLSDSSDAVVFNADGTGDGYLAGQYDAWSKNWVTVPFEDVTVTNGQSLYIMEYAAKLMNKEGLRFTLQEVAEIVQNFDCGVYFTPEFLASNPNLKVNLELKVFTEDADGNKIDDISVATNEFDNEDFGVAAITADGKQTKYYATIEEALAAVGAGDVVIEMLSDATIDYGSSVSFGTSETTSLTINGNGNTLTLNCLDQGDFKFANPDAVLKLNDMTVEKSGSSATGGAWNIHGISFDCEVEISDSTVNQALIFNKDATLTNVDIIEDEGYYAIWVTANGQTLNVTGGSITALNGGRGIKVGDQYVGTPAKVEINLSGLDLNTSSKAAVLISSKAGAVITSSNVDITDVAADSTNIGWIDDDWSQYCYESSASGTVIVNGEIKDASLAFENGTAVPPRNVSITSSEGAVSYYGTIAAAFSAVEDGDTITISSSYTGIENATELDFDSVGDINFTITGSNTVCILPVVTFNDADGDGGKISVTITNSTLVLPEIDSRKNSIVNVYDSSLTFKSKANEVIKSYFNGIVNFGTNAVVSVGQLTTMGYINLFDNAVVKVTWQANIYGNGLVTINDNAQLIADKLNLTGQAYSGRDNTDADRIGQPATIVVNDNGCLDLASYTAGGHRGSTIGVILSGVLSTGRLEVASNATVFLDPYDTAGMNILDGSSIVSAGNIIGAMNPNEGAAIEISGGIYTMDVNDWCVDGLVAVENTPEEGYWTVQKAALPKFVVTLGDGSTVSCETIEEALAAVGAGDVVIEMLSDATIDYGSSVSFGTSETTSLTINGNGNTLTLNCLDQGTFKFANPDAVLKLNDMTVEKSGSSATGGAWNIHGISFDCEVEISDSTVNQALIFNKDATLTNVDIVEDEGYYAIWVTANGQTLNVTGGSITALNGGRGIKVGDQYVGTPAKVEINLSGLDLNTSSKAAVLISSKAGAVITSSNVDITDVAADSTNIGWIDDDWSQYCYESSASGTVIVNGEIKDAKLAFENGTAVPPRPSVEPVDVVITDFDVGATTVSLGFVPESEVAKVLVLSKTDITGLWTTTNEVSCTGSVAGEEFTVTIPKPDSSRAFFMLKAEYK